MALQSSGPISISQIRTELLRGNGIYAVNSYSLRTLSSGTGKGQPDAMSEFYSFHNCYPAGTFVYSTCSGFQLVNVYWDGNCNPYNSVANSCSDSCGGYADGCSPGTIIEGPVCNTNFQITSSYGQTWSFYKKCTGCADGFYWEAISPNC
jgi:hypothetical protein